MGCFAPLLDPSAGVSVQLFLPIVDTGHWTPNFWKEKKVEYRHHRVRYVGTGQLVSWLLLGGKYAREESV